MRYTSTLLLLVWLCPIMLGVAAQRSEAFVVQKHLKNMPVSGRLTDGGTFTGRLTVQKFTVDDLGQLSATGVLAGTAMTGKEGTITSLRLAFSAPASLLDLRGTCRTGVLDLEPVFLVPLGQTVTLVPVTLDLGIVPRQEHLLSSLLCALARLQE